MKNLIIAFLCSLFLSIISGKIVIPLLKKLKAGQPILNYVEQHKDKSGTPTMGGLFFILSACLIFVIFGGIKARLATVSLSIGIAFLIVGFLDDFIKIKYRRNEGLKAYQKIIFQLWIAVIAGIYSFYNGINVFYLPFSKNEIDLGMLTIPIVIIIFLATTNSVNLTDGLDGLAGQVSFFYMLFLLILMMAQREKLSILYLSTIEYNGLYLLLICLIGGVLGFLCFNVSKAKVFMGDTGSLSLGGFIGAISIFSLNSFFIPIIGIMFVLSSISVIVQVVHYKRTKKRILLMSPLHHHFQLKGYSETQIGYYYSLITIVFGLLSILSYL